MVMPDVISQPFSLSSISSLFYAVINIISKRHLKKKWVYFILYFQATFNHGEKSEQEVKVGVCSRNEGGMLLRPAANSATFLIPSQAYLLKVAPPTEGWPSH